MASLLVFGVGSFSVMAHPDSENSGSGSDLEMEDFHDVEDMEDLEAFHDFEGLEDLEDFDDEAKIKIESKMENQLVDVDGLDVMDPDFKKEVKIEVKSEGATIDEDFMMRLHDMIVELFH